MSIKIPWVLDIDSKYRKETKEKNETLLMLSERGGEYVHVCKVRPCVCSLIGEEAALSTGSGTSCKM